MVEKTDKVTEVLGIRIEPDEKKRFEDFVKEESKNNKTFLTNLLDLYELNKSKTKNINLIGDIEELEKYTNKIQQSFVGVINKLESQKDGIREDLNKDLQIYKDKVNNFEYESEHSKSDITTLNEKVNTVNNENIILIKQLEQLQKNFNDQKNQFQEQIQDKLTIIEEYKGKNDTLTGLLKQYEKYPEQLETTKDLLSAAQANILEFESNLREKNSTIVTLTNNIDSLNKKHKSEINNVIEKHTEELERIKEKAEFNKEKALLAKDREDQELINKINQENNEKVKELLNENQQYNEKFSKLMNDNVESLKEKNKPKEKANPIKKQ